MTADSVHEATRLLDRAWIVFRPWRKSPNNQRGPAMTLGNMREPRVQYRVLLIMMRAITRRCIEPSSWDPCAVLVRTLCVI
jgi:hypothetical protein